MIREQPKKIAHRDTRAILEFHKFKERKVLPILFTPVADEVMQVAFPRKFRRLVSDDLPDHEKWQ